MFSVVQPAGNFISENFYTDFVATKFVFVQKTDNKAMLSKVWITSVFPGVFPYTEQVWKFSEIPVQIPD